jgi:hypothetical protein
MRRTRRCDRRITHAATVVLLGASLAAPPGVASAQQPAGSPSFLPAEHWFVYPFADPLASRFAVSLMRTDLLGRAGPERPPFTLPDAADAGDDVVAAIALGGILPLARIASWDDRGGMNLFVDGRVFSRFRIEYPGRDDMGQDWLISGGLEARHGRWSGRTAVTHRSSHLGDEFVASTGAERIEIGGEQLDLLAAWDAPGLARLYAGGAWIFRSYIDWDEQLSGLVPGDRGGVQLGVDRSWRPAPTNPRFGIHAGIDWQAAHRTSWRGAFSAALGIGFDSGALAHRSLRVVTRFYDGPSTMSQFFLTDERNISFELLATF